MTDVLFRVLILAKLALAFPQDLDSFLVPSEVLGLDPAKPLVVADNLAPPQGIR